ncbi:MAG TPA: co-chaperone YbbN [Burkholderiales bacterium]|nr:co-chaperone YbbN [Burkholderiales bacterium]
MHIVEVDARTFEPVVIEGSKKTPVVVDFWAPWCAPCRALTPILEKLAAEYDGRFILAKVNSDENPELSARYGVRGIPSVKAFSDGRVVDEFTGALPERAVREFLDRLFPTPAQELLTEAFSLYAQTHDATRPLELLAQSSELEPANEEVQIARAALLTEIRRYDEARGIIAKLAPLTQMDERVSALKAKLDLAQGAAEAPSEERLTQRLAENPSDMEARLQLAHVNVARKAYREALEHLLEAVRADRRYGDDVARKTMLKVFELLGNQGELVSEFRRKLATAMNQ